MRSGLYNYTDSPRFAWRGERTGRSRWHWPRVSTALCARDTSSYSNTNYLLLGLLLERATGQDLATVLQERVFAPLDMSDTSLLPARVSERPLVRGYDGQRDVTLDRLASCCWGAGGVVSSARDLDAFIEAFFAGRLVGPGSVQEMSSSRGFLVLGGSGYGLGVGLQNTPCGLVLGHSGGLPGFATEAWTNEGGTRSAVVLVNDVSAGDVGHELLLTAICP